jgi:Pyridoxamine 5'-phosphate oxidase
MSDALALTHAQRAFLAAPKRFAALATTDEDGAPRQTVIWYRLLDDDRILVNGRSPRRWCANLDRTGRAAIAIQDGADGYRWLGLVCELDERPDDVAAAREDIVGLAHLYHDDQPDPSLVAAFRTQPRISYRLRITAIHDHLDD